ncbi:hydrogenase assembly chaperone [Clostridium tepidiprofundi DSM 19306]|uniref:Hydrogenase assembly chaperone n=1 Tax=Clostridium tepidiprofundi DSM 19306 TaxID=1121338 RepID=A0A151B7K4_9CLOT|nr:HypC/HybG/HupF family hydrogenase formation chaperone [Clostridium tepidiprofundi]KYH35627.1 hydrogenase assembly chaperone [Clostridium tepidiprofundi DSM 19306]
MCLGVPFKILEINDNNAIGEINNFTKKFRIDLLPNASVGDYVMVHAGFAIQKLKKEDAENIIEAVLEVQNESM